MKDARQLAADALKRVPLWRAGDATLVKSLGGGPASTTWLVNHRDDAFVLRLDTPFARTIDLDRSAELAVVHAATGFAPRVVFARPADGLLVTRFVAGRTWEAGDLTEPRQLERLAGTLRRLHARRPAVRRFDLANALRHYARCLANPRAEDWACQAQDLLRNLTARPPVLCHNDPVAENVVDDGRLWLIDWEYAGLGDPFFDLAVVVRHHDLDRDLATGFVAAYQGGEEPWAMAELECCCKLYDRLLALWLSVVAAHGKLVAAQHEQLARVVARISQL